MYRSHGVLATSVTLALVTSSARAEERHGVDGLPPPDASEASPSVDPAPRPGPIAPVATVKPLVGEERNPLGGLALSWGTTAALVGAGGALFSRDAGASRAVGLLLVWNGIVGGPAVGSFYAGRSGLAMTGIIVRGVGAALGTIGALFVVSGRQHSTVIPAAAVVITLGSVVIEPIIAATLVARDNRRAAEAAGKVTVVPTLVPSPTTRSATPGLALAGAF